MHRQVAILGSTGSIGEQTLQVIQHNRERFTAVALAAGGRRLEALVEQVRVFQPRLVAVGDAATAARLAQQVPASVRVVWGDEGLLEVSTYDEADTVVQALVGAVGMAPTLASLQAGKRVAFANKESLVAAGEIMMEAAQTEGAELLPVDSEHAAVFQALMGERPDAVERIILTASGGPFLNASADEMKKATVDDALAHPTWRMGGKITIDSATLMNKGLEVIEAHWLFSMPYDRIDVVVHPQSIVHSMIELVDGAMIAQMGPADMRGPIQYALGFPHRLPPVGQRLNLIDQTLTFSKPDTSRFPALALAYEAGRIGGTMPAVLNAANEVAVHAFLEKRLAFTSIAPCVQAVMETHVVEKADTLPTIAAADRWARDEAERLIVQGAIGGR